MLLAATELSVLYQTPQKRNPSISDQANWEAISQDLGAILLYRWKCTSAWRTERTECKAGSKNSAIFFLFHLSHELFFETVPLNELTVMQHENWKTHLPTPCISVHRLYLTRLAFL